MVRLGKIIAVLLLVGSVAACVTTGGGYFRPTKSNDTAELSSAAGFAIADDMVAKLAEHIGPGKGTIVLKADDTPFAAALERSLQNRGYAAAIGEIVPTAGAIPLAYEVGTLDGMVMVRLSTPELELTRVYSASAAGATPTSPLSIMRPSPGRGEGA